MSVYPIEFLPDKGRALLLFGSGFLGGNDGLYIREAGLVGTVVDTDTESLEKMKQEYPLDWKFCNEDALEFKGEGLYQVVSVDCPMNLIAECLSRVQDWCNLSTELVTITALPNSDIDIPPGWERLPDWERTYTSCWVVLRKSTQIILRDGTTYPHSFRYEDLVDFRVFLEAKRTIPMIEYARGDRRVDAVTIRHDIDHDVDHALRFAQWEKDHGIRSTYFLLPTSLYWPCPQEARELQQMGFEVGLHQDAFHLGQDELIAKATIQGWVNEMRSWGIELFGAANHGEAGRSSEDIWQYISLEELDLEYEAYQLHRTGTSYYTDNRGRHISWDWPGDRPAHVLIHPEHWQI